MVKLYWPSKLKSNLVFFFFSIFSCCTKSDNQPRKDLAKSGYKMNKEVENLGILLYVGERVQSIN
jgi:hypothetical protein